MPRAALKDLANSKGLASAAAEARAEHKKKMLAAATNGASKDGGNSSDGATAPADTGDEEGGVELWADWPCSCVRLRGEPASVRCAVSLSFVTHEPESPFFAAGFITAMCFMRVLFFSFRSVPCTLLQRVKVLSTLYRHVSALACRPFEPL